MGFAQKVHDVGLSRCSGHSRLSVQNHPDGDPIWEVMTFRPEAA